MIVRRMDSLLFQFVSSNRSVFSGIILVTLSLAFHSFQSSAHAAQPQFYRPSPNPRSAYRYQTELNTTNFLKGEILMMCLNSGIAMENLTWLFGQTTYWTRGGLTSIMFMHYGIALKAKPFLHNGQQEYTKISGGIGP